MPSSIPDAIQPSASCSNKSATHNSSTTVSGSTSTAQPWMNKSAVEQVVSEENVTPRTAMKRLLQSLKLPAKKSPSRKVKDHRNYLPKCFFQKRQKTTSKGYNI